MILPLGSWKEETEIRGMWKVYGIRGSWADCFVGRKRIEGQIGDVQNKSDELRTQVCCDHCGNQVGTC